MSFNDPIITLCPLDGSVKICLNGFGLTLTKIWSQKLLQVFYCANCSELLSLHVYFTWMYSYHYNFGLLKLWYETWEHTLVNYV